MHISKILNHKLVGDSVEGLLKIYQGKEHSMRLLEVKVTVNEVQELHQVMSYRRAFESTTLARINERLNKGENPVTYECFILLAKE